ncbi:MAG: RNA methyltransferase [Pseudomonadota bacterium]
MIERAIKITDANDPRIADYVSIRERDLIRDHQTFICEGKTVLQVLARQAHFSIKSLLILQNRLDGVADIVKSIEHNIPVYTANRNTMDAIAGFPMHRGILATATKKDAPAPKMDAGPIVVASAIANHDNMGALFRNAAAFGAQAVLLDAQCCDPLYRKAIRVSVGGVLEVPFRHGGHIDAIIKELAENGFSIAALATNGSIELANWKPGAQVALLVGSEGTGLPTEVLMRVTTLRIPMHGEFDSLNVATAAAIALHHLHANSERP